MKTKLLFTFIFLTQFILAQQVTLMQPALRDSDKNIVKQEYYTIDINTNIEYKDVQVLYTAYDAEKNPTDYEFEIYDENGDVDDSGNTDNVTYEYYPIANYHIEGSDSIIDNLFPTKIIDANIVNPNTSELINTLHVFYNNDGRFSILQHNEAVWDYLEYQRYNIDENFNVTGGIKDEITMQGDFPTERLTYAFNETSNVFEPSFKEIYYNTFDNGVLTERIVKKITDFTTNTEENYMKETFTFSTNTFERQFFSWNNAANNWQLEWNLVTVYNANNQILSYTYNNWNETTSSWDLTTEYLYNYNAQNLLETYTRNYSDDSEWQEIFTFTYNSDNLLTVLNMDIYLSGTINYKSKQAFYYELETASTNSINTSKISIFPNPTNNVLNIDLEEDFNYQIYSIQGKILKEGSANKQIQVNDLEKGIYFININTKNLEEKHKFIIE